MADVTQILNAIEQGDSTASDELLPVVYDELRSLARYKLAHERPGQTLQATALVHEAYLRLIGSENDRTWKNRGHFFAAAAEAMRRILINRARDKKAVKRGGDRARIDIDQIELAMATPDLELVALDEVLQQLETQDEALAQLVKLRFFAGMTLKEAAQLLDIPPRTADKQWAFARAWLKKKLQPS